MWLQDASTWLVNSPDESLGFILADNGYDVWFANVRGTKYSSEHTSLDSNGQVLFLTRIIDIHAFQFSDYTLMHNLLFFMTMCRIIGIGLGMNWLLMIFLLLYNMSTKILVRQCTMQVIPW